MGEERGLYISAVHVYKLLFSGVQVLNCFFGHHTYIATCLKSVARVIDASAVSYDISSQFQGPILERPDRSCVECECRNASLC